MSKKLTFNILLLGMLAFVFGACGDDDKNEVSEEWKEYQKSLVTRISTLKGEDGGLKYQSVSSDSELGKVYYTPSDYITKHQGGDFDAEDPAPFAKTAKAEVKLTRPEFESDIVVYRYEAWYYSLDEKRAIFDGTEIGGNNVQKAQSAISGFEVDGFKTMLMNMDVGDEYIVCIPQVLAYGTYGKYDKYGRQVIPGYTTLFFNVKLLEVKRP